MSLEKELKSALDIEEVNDETSLEELDSLGRISIMAYLDINQDVILEADELISCKTVADLKTLISEHLADRAEKLLQ